MEIQKEKTFRCWLDSDDKHPGLFGECILPRDDDGMGFALDLTDLRRKYVEITIKELPQPTEKVHW